VSGVELQGSAAFVIPVRQPIASASDAKAPSWCNGTFYRAANLFTAFQQLRRVGEQLAALFRRGAAAYLGTANRVPTMNSAGFTR
jgi:hypothetical protein